MVVSYGYCLMHTGRLEKAQTLENLYDYFCDNADYLFMLGNIYLKVQRNEDALRAFLTAVTCKKHYDEGTNSYRAFHNIGCIYEAYGHYDKARAFYDKAGDYAPSALRKSNLPKP